MEYLFTPNQVISLPDLASKLAIENDRFTVVQMFDGGMGTCYRIIDSNGQSYALKVIHSDLIANERCSSRYIEEIKLWLQFSACEGVAEAIHIVRVNEIPCVISSWMEHGDMNGLIKNKNVENFYSCMDRIISTLQWVYENYHVIHRDLKPGNILLDVHDNAFVADWGLAKIIYSTEDRISSPKELKGVNPKITQAGSFVGTAPYASPEQLMGLPNIDFRSDIYSLGCIMYEWETGKPPFQGKTIQEIATGHLFSQPEKLGGFLKNTTFRAEKIIFRCLEKKPENRYQSYQELLTDLHKLANKHISGFVPYSVKERFLPIHIGYGELQKRFNNNELGVSGNKGFAVVEEKDIIPYLNEAVSLSSLGEHLKAIEIYKRFYIRDLVIQSPNFYLYKFLAVNLANEYNSIGKYDVALEVILSISKAKYKDADYFVNLSNIYISLQKYNECVAACQEGLKSFPDDSDLIGNHTIGLTEIGRLQEAVDSANKRLKLSRNTSSICEAARVLYKFAEVNKNKDFPQAIEYYKQSLSLYKEALDLNPLYLTAKFNEALLLFKMKRYVDSMECCKKIAEIEKCASETTVFYIARDLFWSGNFETAKDFCDKWLKKYPNSVLIKRIRAEILVDGYVLDNYTDDGIRVIEQSSWDFFTNIIKDPQNITADDVIYLAKIHCWMGEDNEIKYGLDLLEWGKKHYADNWKFNYYLSAFALKYNNPQKALQEALECNSKAPWRESVFDLLANAYEAVGQHGNSLKMKSEYDRIKKLKDSLYKTCKSM